jgi:hypothetical protein
MSQHFSKFSLNTWQGTPYFRDNLPADYPTSKVLMASRAFRRLPPNLRKLAEASKAWAMHRDPDADWDIKHWYDDQGNELDPDTGRKLTSLEIDAEWDQIETGLDGFKVYDIPPTRLPDPKTWEPESEGPVGERISDEQLLKDIYSRGRIYVSKNYGIPLEELPGYSEDTVEEQEGEDSETALSRFKRRAMRVLRSKWMKEHPEDKKAVVEALEHADMKWDLCGAAEAAFDVAEDHT